MLGNSKAFASYSVDDAEKAKHFYTEVLGLKVIQDNDMGGILTIKIKEGISVLIYPKTNHTPSTYTVLNFPVDNIVDTVSQLKASGAKFNRYDEKDLKTDENDISRGNGGPSIAWFTDPAGNILSIIEVNFE
ncbi:VOC family protein [Pedobacter lithocola]|uniref:VOC family protein n=1 Tax=Pedobacter lithocola TaxID=1908239 RepID=A0ABV8P6L5_9SPHI